MAALLAAMVLFASPAAAQDAPAPAPAEAVSQTDPPSAAPAGAAPAAPTDFAGLVTSLRDAGFADKEAIVEQLVAQRPRQRARRAARLPRGSARRARARPGRLRRDLRRRSAAVRRPARPVTLKPAGSSPRDALTRIGTNNRLRRVLKGLVARTELASTDPAVRLNAVTELLRSPDAQTTALLRERIDREYETRVRREMQTGLAMADLDGGDKAARLAAIQVLSQRLLPDVLNRLKALVEKAPTAAFVEPDADIRAAAGDAIDRIEQARSIYSGAETLFFGLGLGAVLVLVAIGLAITFGVMGVINMAHGELMMLGAYTTYVVQTLMPNHIGWSIAVAIPAAFLVSGLTGVVIERTVIRFLYGRPLETLLATFGVSLVLQQAVRSIFTALNRSVATPAWMSRHAAAERRAQPHLQPPLHHRVHDRSCSSCCCSCCGGRAWASRSAPCRRTAPMARAMGIRTARVDAMTFGLGSGIAGIAGVALSQLTNVGPNLGQAYIIDSFMVVVFGGVGNLWGALIGGMTMGVISNLLEPAPAPSCQDRRARRPHPLHPAASARPVPADRPRRGAADHHGRRMTIVTRLPAALRDDTGGAVLYGLLAVTAVVVPILALLPPSSPLHLSPYVLTLLGKYLCYAMLALAVDAIWGYCGILSLGHAAFFSLGGYAMGMYLMRQIGTRGVYGDPVLPDFMVFLNWKSLPWFWYGFDHFWFAALMVVLVPGLLALPSAGWRSGRASPASTCRSSPRP